MHHAATFATFVSRSTRVEQSRDSVTTGDEKWRSRARLLSIILAFRRTFFSKHVRARRARDWDVDAVSTAIRDEEDEWRRAR